MAHAKGNTDVNVQKTTQNQNSSWDNTSQARAGSIWDAATQAGNAGPGAPITGASDYYTGVEKAGATGAAALGGDQHAIDTLMNPYQKNVIDATNAQYDKSGQQVVNQTNDLATRANAFGGSRHGVAEGTAIGDNEMHRNATIAGLNQTGYNQTLDRAAQTAQLGTAAAGANANLGFSGVGNPALWRLQTQKQGWLGPQGQQSSGAQTTAGFKQNFDYGIGFGG
jgi:hypothetical protein